MPGEKPSADPADPPRYSGVYPYSVPPSQDHGTVVAALPPEYQPEPEPTNELSPQFRRAVIDYPTVEPPGTIIIDTPNTYLYLTIDHNKAIRYGIGVGREGFTWSGAERIVVTDSVGQKLCGEFAINQMCSSAFSFEGAPVVSIIVLMAANAVRFRCA
jgi:lipoprotein-anchoring transpeptidase ErfK/SrfK